MSDKDKPSVPVTPRQTVNEDINKSYVHERPFPTTQPPTNRAVSTPPPAPKDKKE